MKQRLDIWLLRAGMVESREKGRIAIERGYVRVNGSVVEKPSFGIDEEDSVELTAQPLLYVSRGGEKLEKALREFKIDIAGKIAMDIGASTGGFTDCLLQHGAQRVVAVDVGTNQLHLSLRADKRILSLESTDIRTLTGESLPFVTFDLIVADVSFISLSMILPDVFRFMKDNGEGILLLKPQFEQDKRKRTKKGIIRDPLKLDSSLAKIVAELERLHFCVAGYTTTDADGKTKNIEYLIWVKKRI